MALLNGIVRMHLNENFVFSAVTSYDDRCECLHVDGVRPRWPWQKGAKCIFKYGEV